MGDFDLQISFLKIQKEMNANLLHLVIDDIDSIIQSQDKWLEKAQEVKLKYYKNIKTLSDVLEGKIKQFEEIEKGCELKKQQTLEFERKRMMEDKL